MNSKAKPALRIGFVLSTLAIWGGCAPHEQELDEQETVAESVAAVALNNTIHINGIGSNGSGSNGSGSNGSGSNGSGSNGSGSNGSGSNGSGSNGSGSNGASANLVGLAFDLTTVSGVTINGTSIQGAWLDKGTVKAIQNNGVVLSGQSLIGAQVTGQLEDGSPVTLRLDGMESFTSAVGTSLSRYVISFTRPGSDVRAHVCGLDANGAPIKTIPISGRWNYQEGVPDGGSKEESSSLITFACQGFALYKCIDYGYPPWKTVNGVKLNNHHQACVRMIRADYCGDGRSWTVDGTIINLYDNLGIQADTESWPMEAEWSIDGARCLSHQRIQSLPTVPSCSFERSPLECGQPPQWGSTLLVSEAL
jgi:uncharacterized protein YjbI with pentapeptide repeats